MKPERSVRLRHEFSILYMLVLLSWYTSPSAVKKPKTRNTKGAHVSFTTIWLCICMLKVAVSLPTLTLTGKERQEAQY